jgi:hypothetical protein
MAGPSTFPNPRVLAPGGHAADERRVSRPQPQQSPPGSAAVARPGISRGVQATAHKIVQYGPGGIGKSKLASLLSLVGIEPLFIDLENGTKFLDVARIEPQSLDELRAALHDSQLLAPFGAVVLDSGTKAEELATAWMLANIRHEKGTLCESIEDYGYGKGYTHLYETFMLLLGDLDAVARGGRHVVMICHDCTATVPNPASADYIRYEPRLQSPASGKFSIRNRVREWCDHMLYIGYDVAVGSDGKAKGSGTRAIYTTERPTHVSKSRTLNETIPYTDGDPAIWNRLFNKE